jgi:hypothetical protein
MSTPAIPPNRRLALVFAQVFGELFAQVREVGGQ